MPEPDEEGHIPLSIVLDLRDVDTVELPAEYWLRDFLEIDDEPASLLGFLTQFGALEAPGRLSRTSGAFAREAAAYDGVEPDSAPISPAVADLGLSPTQLRGHRDHVQDQLDDVLGDWELPEGEVAQFRRRTVDGGWQIVSVTPVPVALQSVLVSLYQAVFRTWLLLMSSGELTAAMLTEEPSEEIRAAWDEAGYDPPETNFAALDTAMAVINAMTQDFGPYVGMLRDGDNVPFETPLPRIRTALGLQVQAWLAAGADVRRCANESCGRWFVQQQGRARYGTPRSRGVMYCSASCAQAQASRDYRRRKAHPSRPNPD